jgi:Subtilase family
VVDSGVHASHPHVQGVSGGVGFDRDGRLRDDFVDRLGHGTAVTAAIREKAPDAEIVAVKIFDTELATSGTALVAALEWALADGARLVNLSLGTTNPAHEQALMQAVQRIRENGAFLVSAAPHAAARWLPGALPGVVSVEVDWALARDTFRAQIMPGGDLRVWASGLPRPIPGVPPELNLRGQSFAVANVTGLVARALSASPDHLLTSIRRALVGASGTVPSS